MRRAFLLPALMLLAGCSKPVFVYDGDPGARLTQRRKVALDPRTDVVHMMEGKRASDPGPVREMVLRELEAKGYRVLPASETEAADLWVEIAVFANAGAGPAGGGREGGHGGFAGGGRGMRGGRGGGRMGFSPGDAGAATPSARPPAEMPALAPAPAFGPGLVYVVKLLDPGTRTAIWYGRMDVEAALKQKDRGGPQPLQEHLRRFLVPLPPAGK